MKGVVLETRGKYAAVLKEDGTVEKIQRVCRVGETIELEDSEKKIVRFPKRATQWVAAAAAALVVMSGATYGYNNAYAYSYVTLDANPSIEYVLNRRNQVLKVEALNEDAESIVAELTAAGVRKESLSDVISETMAILYENEYLGEDMDNCVLINVSSRGETQKEKLTDEANDAISDEELSVYVTNSTREQDHSAEAIGMSAGRYVLMQDIATMEGEDAGSVTEEKADSFTQAPLSELLERSGRRPPEEKKDGGSEQPQAREEQTAPVGAETDAQPQADMPAESQQGQDMENAPMAPVGQQGQPNSQSVQTGGTGTGAPAEAGSPAEQKTAPTGNTAPDGSDPYAGTSPDSGMSPENGNGQAVPAENGMNREPGTGMGQDGNGVPASGEMQG